MQSKDEHAANLNNIDKDTDITKL